MQNFSKKIIILIFILLIFHPGCYSLEWVNLTSMFGSNFSLDIDSIKEYEGYYFYNIKTDSEVLTIQTSIKSSFSARINKYTLSQYNELNGDYSNITKNITKNLEAIQYGSTVYTCRKYIKNNISKQNKPEIILEVDNE